MLENNNKKISVTKYYNATISENRREGDFGEYIKEEQFDLIDWHKTQTKYRSKSQPILCITHFVRIMFQLGPPE